MTFYTINRVTKSLGTNVTTKLKDLSFHFLIFSAGQIMKNTITLTSFCHTHPLFIIRNL